MSVTDKESFSFNRPNGRRPFPLLRSFASPTTEVAGLQGRLMNTALKAVPADVGTLFLVRHGRTALNAQGRFQGHSQAPLDAVGREQIRATAARLQAEGVRGPLILASDLPRARQSADIIAAATGGGVQALPALRELDFGEWEGQAVADIEAQYRDAFARLRSSDPTFCPPGGESFQEVAGRAFPPVAAHLPAAGQTVVVVAHQLTILALLGQLLAGHDRTLLGHPNGAFSRLWLRGGQVVGAEVAVRDHLPQV